MDINNLRIFLTACETLSFTETAKGCIFPARRSLKPSANWNMS